MGGDEGNIWPCICPDVVSRMITQATPIVTAVAPLGHGGTPRPWRTGCAWMFFAFEISTILNHDIDGLSTTPDLPVPWTGRVLRPRSLRPNSSGSHGSSFSDNGVRLNPTWTPTIPLFHNLTAWLDREEVLKCLRAPRVVPRMEKTLLRRVFGF